MKDTTRKLIEAVGKADLETYATLFAPDAVAHHPMADEPMVGRDAIVAAEAALHGSFTDVSVKVHQLVAEGNIVVAEVTLSATNTGPIELAPGEEIPATGRRIEIPSVWVHEIGEDGLITAARDYFDAATLFTQLGLTG